jgi:hypothetical protein
MTTMTTRTIRTTSEASLGNPLPVFTMPVQNGVKRALFKPLQSIRRGFDNGITPCFPVAMPLGMAGGAITGIIRTGISTIKGVKNLAVGKNTSEKANLVRCLKGAFTPYDNFAMGSIFKKIKNNETLSADEKTDLSDTIKTYLTGQINGNGRSVERLYINRDNFYKAFGLEKRDINNFGFRGFHIDDTNAVKRAIRDLLGMSPDQVLLHS